MMEKINRIDLGSVQVDRNVFDEIISSAIGEVDGVQLTRKNIGNRLSEFFGKSNASGIDIKVDEKQEVALDVKILVRYGMNIPAAAKQVQEVIKSIVDKTLDVNLKDVNVNVQGIARGEK